MYDAVTSGGSGGSGTGYQNSSGSSGSGRSQGNYLSYQDYPQPPPTQKDLQRASSTTAHLPTTSSTTNTSAMMNPNTRESYQIPTYRDLNNHQPTQPMVSRTNLGGSGGGGGGEVSNNNRRFYQTNQNIQPQQRTFHNPKLSQPTNIIYEGYDDISPSVIPSPSPSMSSTGFIRGNGGGRSPSPSSCGAVADINPMCIPCLAIYSHLKDCPLCIQLLQNSSFVQEKNKEMNRMRNIEYAILVIVSIILLWNLVPFLSSLFTMMKQRRSSTSPTSSSSSDQRNPPPTISSAFSNRPNLLFPHNKHGPHHGH
jgi:hypothetical protein